MSKMISRTIVCCILVLLIPVLAYAAPGDLVPDRETSIWQIAAATGGTSSILSAMNDMPAGYHAGAAIDTFVWWAQIRFGQPTSIATAFPDDVYYTYFEKIEGLNFQNARVKENAEPPANVVKTAGQLTCDEDPTGAARTVLLYLWNNAVPSFTESAITGVLATGTWTFSAIPSGTYVLAFQDGLTNTYYSLPTLFQSVTP